MQTLGKKGIGVNFSANAIAHMLRLIKSVLARKIMDNPSNQELNFDAISNVMTFLTFRVKV